MISVKPTITYFAYNEPLAVIDIGKFAIGGLFDDNTESK